MSKKNKPIYKVGDEVKIDIIEVKKDINVAESFIEYIPMHNRNNLFITKVFSKEYTDMPHMYQINEIFNLQENEIILVQEVKNES